MEEPFIGSEAVAAGLLARHALRRGFIAMHNDVYIARGTSMSPVLRAKACWLRSRRRGVLAGFSAAALHGARWIDPARPASILDTNRRPTRGVRAWLDSIEDDEVCVIDGMRVTTPARTALDIASRYPVNTAVAAIDALVRATHLKMADVDLLADRYRGRRGIRTARTALGLVDGGAESPRETWLRLLLIRAGFPRPQTQIPVHNEFGVLVAELDMGWGDLKVAAEYEGEHHRTSPDQFNKDIRRYEEVMDAGWIDIRVTARDTEGDIVRRVGAARERRTPRRM
jgi:AbiEi antitoxin C-terminal domain